MSTSRSSDSHAIAFPPIAPSHPSLAGEIEERPPEYVGPNLSPLGLKMTPLELGQGVFALIATPLPRDNGGVIFGEDAALVVDSGVNVSVGRYVQELARALTDRPLRYLVNTTYHGDHTFGNAAFPADVRIVSSRANALSMTDLGKEKRIRSRNMHGDVAALDEVTEWRRPDVTFEHFLELDLGGIKVQLWHFGAGNGPGDTMVYVPSARAVWTGNFLGHRGIAPMLLEGGPRPYIESLERMKATLDISVVIPGHGPIDKGNGGIDWMIGYLRQLDEEVGRGRAGGLTLQQLLDRRKAPQPPPLDRMTPEAAQGLASLNRHMDRLNVLSTYRAFERE
jgi:cyclase